MARNVLTGDDTQSTSEEFRAVSDHSPTDDCSEIRNDLGDGDSVGTELELIGEHRWIEILTSMRLLNGMRTHFPVYTYEDTHHEIEARHQEH